MKNMILLVLPLALLFSISTNTKAKSQQCYSESASFYLSFDKKTSYFASRGSQMNIPKNCDPVYIWGLIRHGTRYPSVSLITLMNKLHTMRNEIITNHKHGRGNLCEADLKNIEKWNTNLTTDLHYELTHQGIEDLKFLAQVMKKTFPKLLKSQKKESFVFLTSATNRTRDSAIVLSNELIGTNFTTLDGNNITENDELLHFHSHCPKYQKEVEKNSTTYEEINLFKESALLHKHIAEISIRLGYVQTLSHELLRLMYETCAYENAWHINSKPPFCAAFSTEDLKIIEYIYDMEQYYRFGFGNSFSSKLGCPIVRDMMLSLTNAASNNQTIQKGKFLISHSEAILPTMVKLGLNEEEEPLRHDNFQKFKEQRKWKISSFDSFAANLIAVLYECTDIKDRIVIMYQNERQVTFAKCSSQFCTLKELQQMFQDVFTKEHCNSEFCRISQPLKSTAVSTLFSIWNIFIILILIE